MKNVLEHVKYLFEKVFRRPGPMLERNLKQAEVPDVCTVLQNERGRRRECGLKKNGKIFIHLPGVPHEMKGLMTDEVFHGSEKAFDLPFIVHRTAFTSGKANQ